MGEGGKGWGNERESEVSRCLWAEWGRWKRMTDLGRL